jgi:hypothetical protein
MNDRGLLMDQDQKPNFNIWPEQARRFALALIEILNNDEERLRLSEYTSILKQPPPRSAYPDEYDQEDHLRTIRVGATFALPAYGTCSTEAEIRRHCAFEALKEISFGTYRRIPLAVSTIR